MLKQEIQFQNNEISQRFFRNAGLEGGLSENKLEYRKLYNDFYFVINGHYFVIKPGFWWDGASIPKFLWGIIGGPWQEDIAPGALIHDVLFGSQVLPRKTANRIMYEVNRLNGMSWTKNQTVYNGLRIGGWKAWQDKTDSQIRGVREHLYIDDVKSSEIKDFSFLYI
jgi:hypothetical protein